MHLSILTDNFISDSLADTRTMRPEDEADPGSHLDALFRGIVFAAALLLPFLVSIGSGWLQHQGDAELAPATIFAVPADTRQTAM